MSTTGRIGVLADSVQRISELNRLVRGAGFSVDKSVEMASAVPQDGAADKALPDMDIWVVNLDFHNPAAQSLVDTLDSQNKYVIYDNDLDAAVPEKGEKPLLPAELRRQRERRLAAKLAQWIAPEAVASSRKRARQVWVLAASTGGPEAVMTFLKGIPANLSGVAFIYAQHIELSALGHLLKAVEKNSGFAVSSINRACTLQEQTVYVVSPQQQFDLLDGGTLTLVNGAWSGQFKPSLNQVIAKVARVYGARGGAVVFSGMGDDGAASCTMLRHRGGQVWVQTPASCAVDSMPVSVNAKGCVHLQAGPEELAKRFVSFQKYGSIGPTNSATPE